MQPKTKAFPWIKFIFTSLLPLFAWMAIIFYFSAQQKVAVTGDYWLSFIVFKTLHLIEYAILYTLNLRCLHFLKVKYKYLWAFILTLLYAFSDELHQLYVPTREGKFRDVFIDCLGAFFASTAIGWQKKLRHLLLT